MARKLVRMCVVCGKEFSGTAGAITCSGACRTALVRLKAAKKRPEYIFIAKSKGTKIPDLNAPKGVKFKRGEKKQKPQPVIEEQIVFVEPTPERFDGERLANITFDEAAKFPAPPTREQIWAKIDELEKEKRGMKDEKMPPGMLVRMWALQRNSRMQEIQEKIDLLKKQVTL